MYLKENLDGENVSNGVNSIGSDLFAGVDEPENHADTPRVSSPVLQFDINDTATQKPRVQEVVKYIDKPQRRITSITIFFDDGSFETFPGKP